MDSSETTSLGNTNDENDSIRSQNPIDIQELVHSYALTCGLNKAYLMKMSQLLQGRDNLSSDEAKVMRNYIELAIEVNDESLEPLRVKFGLNESIDDALSQAEAFVLNEQPFEDIGEHDGVNGVTMEETVAASSASDVSSPLLSNNIRHREREATQISIEDASSDRRSDAAVSRGGNEGRRREGEPCTEVNPRSQQLRENESSNVREQFNVARFKEETSSEGSKLFEKYLTLNFGQDEDNAKPIATSTNLVSACKLKLLGEFTKECLCTDNINGLLQNLLCVIEGVNTCREQFADIEEQRAALLQSMPNYSDVSQSRGALMNSLGGKAGIDYKIVLSRFAEESAAGQAIKDHGKGKLTVKALESFSIHSLPEQALIQVVIHLDTAVEVLSEFTDYDLFIHLSQDSLDCREFGALSAELYQRQFGHELVAGSITLLQLIVDVIVPFLRSVALEDKMKAVKLALLIKKHVTNVGNGKGPRKGVVMTRYRAVAKRPVRGNGNEVGTSAQEDYFDDRKHRAGTVAVFFVFLLINEIEAKFGGGCRVGLQILDLSWTDLQRQCNKLLQIFDTSSAEAFVRVRAESEFKALNSNVTKEKRTNVVIFNRQQMDCLHALLQFD